MMICYQHTNENFNHVVEITEAYATENEKSETVNRHEMSGWPANVNIDEMTCEEDNVPLVQFVNTVEQVTWPPATLNLNGDSTTCTEDNIPLAQLQGRDKGKPKSKRSVPRKTQQKKSKSSKQADKNQDDFKSEVEDKIEIEIFETDSDMEIQSDSAASELSESSNDESDANEDHCDGSLTWSRIIRNVPLPQFTGPDPGRTQSLASDATPLDYFYQIFPSSVFKTIADSTNKYVPIYAANRKKCDPTYVEEFVERIEEDDIKAYIGIRMIMAIDPKPSIQDYWSTNTALQNSFIATTMVRNQFLKIQRYFHINNPEKDISRIKDKEKSKVEQESNLLHK